MSCIPVHTFFPDSTWQTIYANQVDAMARYSYILAQFLRLLPRYEFQRIATKYRGDTTTASISSAGTSWHA